MLIAALGATVIGFVLLIAALIAANMYLAIACVVVCAVGVLLLLGDVLTYRRAERDSADEAAPRAKVARGASDPGVAAAARGSDEHDPETIDQDASGSSPLAGAAGSEHGDAASTLGYEEFGHHAGDAPPTRELAIDLRRVSAVDWTHESAADTDDEAEHQLYAKGEYDPDKTDLIARIDDGPSWGEDSWHHPDVEHDVAAEHDEKPGRTAPEPPASNDRTQQFPRPEFDE